MSRNYESSSMANQRGQGMMEYIIIVAMIAVAAIGTYSMFGRTIRNQTAGMASEIAGQKADEMIKQAGESSGKSGAFGRADVAKGMADYNKDNDQSSGK